jgi:hypothetical protein
MSEKEEPCTAVGQTGVDASARSNSLIRLQLTVWQQYL